VGLLIYILGSVLCGLAWSIPSLVVFRAALSIWVFIWLNCHLI